ncbi:FKBP-type peptidyl-prolyl cis-trans isomerase [Psychroflexus salis]|nr:hypothetical protein [Psychroflexus salis]
MKKIKHLLFLVSLLFFMNSCGDDDDNTTRVPPRDAEEVRLENEIDIQTFLETYYFEVVDNPANPNFERIVFKKLDDPDAPADASPIIEAEELTTKNLTHNEVDYQMYILNLREGATTERKPTFADSVLITYQGYTMEQSVFDGTPTPLWLDLSSTIVGFRETLVEHSGSSGFVENPDGTFAFNEDYGTGAVIIPSGLAYFNQPPTNSGIGLYEPIIFTYQLYRSRLVDHDRDGIPSYMEDLNGTRKLDDVDTDEDGFFNYVDSDDDGDEVPTSEEIIIGEDGSISFPDTNGNGTPDYLDPTYP